MSGICEEYCQRELGHPRRWANRAIYAQDFGSSDDPKDGMFSTGESEYPTPPHVIAAVVAAFAELGPVWKMVES